MADKKIDKKTVVTNDLSLPEQLIKKREELLTARQGLGSTLQNPHVIKVIKKDIARIMTQINAPKTKAVKQQAINSPKKGVK